MSDANECFVTRATSLVEKFSSGVFDNILAQFNLFKQCGCEFCEFREKSEKTTESSLTKLKCARSSSTSMEKTLKAMFDSP